MERPLGFTVSTAVSIGPRSRQPLLVISCLLAGQGLWSYKAGSSIGTRGCVFQIILENVHDWIGRLSIGHPLEE
jgi:hypothetical protein